MGRVTLQTIADRLGVSRMTVSNAFSRPDQLSASLRGRILSVAEELGYVGPDPTARALASGTTAAIGLLLSDMERHTLTDEVTMSFVAAIADELVPTGLALTLISAEPRGDVVPGRDVAVDGVLVYSCDRTSPAVSWLMRRRIPLVFVDQTPAPGISSVNIDDRSGAAAAAQHLVDLGHRRVAVVTAGFSGDMGVLRDARAAALGYVERERVLGWLGPLEAAKIRPVVMRLAHGVPQDVGYEAGRLLLARDERPSAVLCISDAVAQGVLRAAEDAGLRVPEDLSVVGFDDNPVARRTKPALTTVRQDADAKGRAAVAALRASIERDRAQRPAGRGKHVVLPTQLVVRESTAPPKRSRRAS